MKSFKLTIKNPKVIMPILGYTEHKDGWIKIDDRGRFHAQKFSKMKFHYDVTINNKHVVFPMIETLKKERERVLKLLPRPVKLGSYRRMIKIKESPILFENEKKAKKYCSGRIILKKI